MFLRVIPVGPIETNCYIIGCEHTSEALVVDPGGDFEMIHTVISKNKLKPLIVVNTHAHIDHIVAVEELKEHYNIKFGLNRNDLALLESAPEAATAFGFPNVEVPKVDFYLKDGDLLKVGKLSFKVIETPGHTKGSVCFYGNGILISGDTLFQNSIGRTDLPGGSLEEIIKSITKKLLTLDDSTVVYPGHGDKSTIGDEKKSNPFIKEKFERI